MRSLLPDTNVLVDFLNGVRGLSDIIETADRLVITPIVLGEFFAGLGPDVQSRRHDNALANLMEDAAVEYSAFSESTPLFYARTFQFLKAQGTPIPTNDIWVAAFAQETGSVLLTRDRHFRHIPTLLIESP